jgi:hypothetical protein
MLRSYLKTALAKVQCAHQQMECGMCFYDFIGVHCVSKSRAAGGGVEKNSVPIAAR